MNCTINLINLIFSYLLSNYATVHAGEITFIDYFSILRLSKLKSVNIYFKAHKAAMKNPGQAYQKWTEKLQIYTFGTQNYDIL